MKRGPPRRHWVARYLISRRRSYKVFSVAVGEHNRSLDWKESPRRYRIVRYVIGGVGVWFSFS